MIRIVDVNARAIVFSFALLVSVDDFLLNILSSLLSLRTRMSLCREVESRRYCSVAQAVAAAARTCVARRGRSPLAPRKSWHDLKQASRRSITTSVPQVEDATRNPETPLDTLNRARHHHHPSAKERGSFTAHDTTQRQ